MKKIQLQLDAVLLEEGLGLFLSKCKSKNLTEKSIISYKNKFGKFIDFVGNIPVEDVNSRMVDRYIIYCQEMRGMNGVSINSDLRAVRAVFNYLYKEGYVPFKLPISLLKVDKEIKETYTIEELRALLKKPNMKRCSFTEYKVWVLVNYLLATGNRISTCLEIKIGDIDLDNKCIILRKTKNRKQQIIPISSSLLEVLIEYLKYRRGSADDYLFCSSVGLKGDLRSYQKHLADYNKSRGVNKTSAHLFRHTYAKMFILNGGDAFRLQQLLGHSSMYITKEYVNMFSNELSMGYDNFNPLNSVVANCSKIKM